MNSCVALYYDVQIRANLVSLISIGADAVDPWTSKYYMDMCSNNRKRERESKNVVRVKELRIVRARWILRFKPANQFHSIFHPLYTAVTLSRYVLLLYSVVTSCSFAGLNYWSFSEVVFGFWSLIREITKQWM